jgi:hypothetical protein
MFRLLQIDFTNLDQLYPVHDWEQDNLSDINLRKIQISYRLSNTFQVILYGFDREIKWSTGDISKLNEIFNIIDKMPMSNIQNIKTSDKNQNCGFYNYNPSHCFQDLTHQTCCLLGSQARKYADESGNPIGKASTEAFYKNFGYNPEENTLTPWCTCIGSQVCSYYSKKFGSKDGTHIKFIHDLKNNKITLDRQEDKYLVYKHKTPGIF